MLQPAVSGSRRDADSVPPGGGGGRRGPGARRAPAVALVDAPSRPLKGI